MEACPGCRDWGHRSRHSCGREGHGGRSVSTGRNHGLKEAVTHLQQHLHRYARRKRDFSDHPQSSPARTRRLLDRLGRPDSSQPIVWVVGTKGKGSTAAILESILRAAGFTTGLYTSPHLHSPRERIQVNRSPIARPAFAGMLRLLLADLRESLYWDDLGPATLFEGLTALAMTHFARHGVGIAIVEAGMGGRYDATHALSPLLTLLTPIALDHEIYLGKTLQAIAREKVGGIAPGATVLSGPQQGPVWRVVEAHCREIGAALVEAGPNNATGVDLLGPHQTANAGLALAAVSALRQRGWTIPDEEVRRGLSGVQWPGRLEIIAGRPVTTADGAHNPAAARALAQALRTAHGGSPLVNRPLVVVTGCSSDKDLEGIVSALAPVAAAAVTARTAHYRSADPALLARLWRERGVHATEEKDIRSALWKARSMAGPAGLVCLTGSFFVVAEAREALGLAVREPWPVPVVGSNGGGQ